MTTPDYTSKFINRFWSKVDKTQECWLWIGSTYPNGYGRYFANGKVYMTHRLSWEMENGAIPEGMIIMHTCDTPGCVRGSHLRLGTHAENSADMVQKGRHDKRVGKAHPHYGTLRTHCNQGHELTPDNVIFTNGGKSRRCKICYEVSSLEGSLRYRANHREEINERKRASREPFKTGVATGERHGLTTLTSEQVIEIRTRYSNENPLFYILAKEYNVSPTTIANIIHRKTWKHI